MSEEDVIRRRLLIDGDGTGDDRRLNVLLKTLIKWCNTNDQTPEDSKAIHDRMLAQLAQCEFAVTKSQLSSQMMAAELENYEKLSHTIEKGISDAKLHIEDTKVNLKRTKTIRRNKIEYDVLAKVINEQPDRKETEEKLDKCKKELASLDATKDQLEKRLELRRKQFHVLITSIHQLQALLDEGDTDDMNLSLEDIDDLDTEQMEAMEAMEVHW